jgi:glycine oxidase
VIVPRTPDVLVIGGGIVGCAIARELAGSGRRVAVIDRGAIGGEASAAAAGALGVASGEDEGDRLELRRAALACFPDLVEALRDEVGIDVGFSRCGAVALALGPDDLAVQAALVARRTAQGLRAERCDAAGVRELVPMASTAATSGVLFPDDAMVVADRLTVALAASARRRGVDLLPGTPAVAVERRDDRVVRVRAGNTWVEPATVVVATGAWGDSAIADLDVGVVVVPVRGQMLALRPRRIPRHAITSGSGFLIPRPHGEVWVGATFEEAGLVKAVTPEGLRALATHVERLAPELLAAPVVRTWAGLRPLCRAGGPVIGRAATLANVFVALGHHRNGILLAPLTAVALRACVEDIAPPDATRPFLRG